MLLPDYNVLDAAQPLLAAHRRLPRPLFVVALPLLRRIKGLPKSWSPACRLFIVGQKAKTILEVCADYAFFDLTFAFCKNLANLLGMAVTGNKGNFPSFLFDMIKHVTKRSNPEVLERLRMRIAANDLSSALMPTLLGLDETLEIVDPWAIWHVTMKGLRSASFRSLFFRTAECFCMC